MEYDIDIDEYYANNMIKIQEEAAKYLFNKDLKDLTYEEDRLHAKYIYDLFHPIWKPIIIDGIDTGYKVSNISQVRNKKDKILSFNGKFYNYVHITINSKKYNCIVHRLVTTAFIPNPENKPEVNHINSNKTCNWVGNLEWVTAEENIKHAIKYNLLHTGINSKMSKYTEKNAHDVCKLATKGIKINDISKSLKLSYRFVSGILQNFEWESIRNQYNIPSIYHNNIKKNSLKYKIINEFKNDEFNINNIIKDLNISNKKSIKKYITRLRKIYKRLNNIN